MTGNLKKTKELLEGSERFHLFPKLFHDGFHGIPSQIHPPHLEGLVDFLLPLHLPQKRILVSVLLFKIV